MSDPTALHDQAIAAAADVLAQMGSTLPPELTPMIRAGLAIAWLEGRAAGGQEAQAVVRGFLESLQ